MTIPFDIILQNKYLAEYFFSTYVVGNLSLLLTSKHVNILAKKYCKWIGEAYDVVNCIVTCGYDIRAYTLGVCFCCYLDEKNVTEECCVERDENGYIIRIEDHSVKKHENWHDTYVSGTWYTASGSDIGCGTFGACACLCDTCHENEVYGSTSLNQTMLEKIQQKEYISMPKKILQLPENFLEVFTGAKEVYVPDDVYIYNNNLFCVIENGQIIYSNE